MDHGFLSGNIGGEADGSTNPGKISKELDKSDGQTR
jgi:hypothetical protein